MGIFFSFTVLQATIGFFLFHLRNVTRLQILYCHTLLAIGVGGFSWSGEFCVTRFFLTLRFDSAKGGFFFGESGAPICSDQSFALPADDGFWAARSFVHDWTFGSA